MQLEKVLLLPFSLRVKDQSTDFMCVLVLPILDRFLLVLTTTQMIFNVFFKHIYLNVHRNTNLFFFNTKRQVCFGCDLYLTLVGFMKC